MNRKVFMERLRECLKDIPTEEREEALAYYESYFEEAGEENEGKVIEELESAEKVAETIKNDLFDGPEGNPRAPQTWEEEKREEAGAEDKTGKIVLMILVAILTFPIWIAVFGVLFGVVVAVFGILFGCAVGAVAGTGGVLAAGVTLISLGIGGCISGDVAAGILVMGTGFLVTALGVLLLICMIWFCGKAVPVCCRWIVNLCKKLFQRRKEQAL